MCHHRYRGYYANPICYRRRRCGGRLRGCHHRRCREMMMLQNGVGPAISTVPTMTSQSVMPRANTAPEPIIAPASIERGVVDEPPPYSELRPTDHIDMPEQVRRISQTYFEKTVSIDSLGKQSGYIMVNTLFPQIRHCE